MCNYKYAAVSVKSDSKGDVQESVCLLNAERPCNCLQHAIDGCSAFGGVMKQPAGIILDSDLRLAFLALAFPHYSTSSAFALHCELKRRHGNNRNNTKVAG